MKKIFENDYLATVEALEKTKDGVRVTLDIKLAKKESIDLEQRGKHALFRSILKDRPLVLAKDFMEEIL